MPIGMPCAAAGGAGGAARASSAGGTCGGSFSSLALRVPGVHAASPNCCSLTTFASSNPTGDVADIATGDGASAAFGDGAAAYGAGAGDTDGEGAARAGRDALSVPFWTELF